MPGRLTHAAVRALDRLLPKSKKPEHLQTGQKGEEAAYFYLRRLGYVMVARNWRSPRRRGELDLVGWDGDCLCFVEVKTRTTMDVKPAEAAVDAEKQQELRGMAKEYVRLLSQRKKQTSKSTTEALRHGEEACHLAIRSSGHLDKSPDGPISRWRDLPRIRFDVLSIYYLEGSGKLPHFALFKNCFPLS